MQLVKSTIPKKINRLQPKLRRFLLASPLFLLIHFTAFSQDNSPYTRYGIGDLVSTTHIGNRAMGGISAGFTDQFGYSINFNNPASFSSFQTVREQKSKKLVSGRAVLDLGLNFENHTLIEPATDKKFVAGNALFSYLQIGVPLRHNWGMSFGLRPISRISYKIIRNERLYDPNTGLPIDSAITQFTGDGGAYVVSLGTGFKVKNLSLGVNVGYMFGKKDYQARRGLINDTVDYLQANYETKTTFGNLTFDLGLQYRIPMKNNISLTLGAYGNWNHKLNGSQDIIRETFFFDPVAGNTRLDSVSIQNDIKGKIIYPSSITIGFVTEKQVQAKEGGWLFGMDFSQQSWSQYRFYGATDSVRNNWTVKAGGAIFPKPGRNYWSNVVYRAGLFFGPDYIRVKNKMSRFGGSMGFGFPIGYNRLSPGQVTRINVALEYSKRGNDTNILRENTFRFSLGFSLSDFWFIKRKYD